MHSCESVRVIPTPGKVIKHTSLHMVYIAPGPSRNQKNRKLQHNNNNAVENIKLFISNLVAK